MSNCSHFSTPEASAPSCKAQHLCSQKLRTSVDQSIYQWSIIKQFYPYALVMACPKHGCAMVCPISGSFSSWDLGNSRSWMELIHGHWHQCTIVFFARMSSGTSKHFETHLITSHKIDRWDQIWHNNLTKVEGTLQVPAYNDKMILTRIKNRDWSRMEPKFGPSAQLETLQCWAMLGQHGLSATDSSSILQSSSITSCSRPWRTS